MSHYIDFVWFRDSNGYCLLDAEPPPKNYLATIGNDGSKPQRIIGRGGEMIKYRPAEEFPSLFSEFARIRKAKGLLDFVIKYGCLDHSTKGIFQNTEVALEAAANIRKVIDYKGGQEITIGSMGINLSIDRRSRRSQLCMKPKTLMQFLWLQLWLSYANGLDSKQCLFCKAWFNTGIGSGKRRDAKFCSEKHRIEYNSRKRTKG